MWQVGRRILLLALNMLCSPSTTGSRILGLVLGRRWLVVYGRWLLLSTKNLLERQRWRLGEQLEHFVEELAEVEFAAPFRVVVARGPIDDEVVFDAIVLLDVIQQLDDLWFDWFVQVDIGCHYRILTWQEELEPDRANLLSVQLDWQFATQLYHVVLLLPSEADSHDTGFNCIVLGQECRHIVPQLLQKLVVGALI